MKGVERCNSGSCEIDLSHEIGSCTLYISHAATSMRVSWKVIYVPGISRGVLIATWHCLRASGPLVLKFIPPHCMVPLDYSCMCFIARALSIVWKCHPSTCARCCAAICDARKLPQIWLPFQGTQEHCYFSRFTGGSNKMSDKKGCCCCWLARTWCVRRWNAFCWWECELSSWGNADDDERVRKSAQPRNQAIYESVAFQPWWGARSHSGHKNITRAKH